MSDIFREVDEEVRQDRALAFWSRYQLWFLVLAIVVVAAAAGWRLYSARRQAFAEETGTRYLAAVQASRDGKTQDAIGLLEAITQNGTAGYRELAALRVAEEYGATDVTRAVKAFDAFAADGSNDPVFRDVARLRAALLLLDSGDGKDAQNRLAPLASAGSPFRSTARELLAAAALTSDDLDAAGRWLDEIVRDPSAPADIRGRAEAFLGLVRSGRQPAK